MTRKSDAVRYASDVLEQFRWKLPDMQFRDLQRTFYKVVDPGLTIAQIEALEALLDQMIDAARYQPPSELYEAGHGRLVTVPENE